jgi:hypothetical protein
MAGVIETMKRGYKTLMADPGRMKRSIKSQAGRTGAAAKDIAGKAGMAATRGAGLGPARGLRDVLLEAKRKIAGS